MHVNPAIESWLERLLEGIQNSNNDAEIMATKAYAAGQMYKALETAINIFDDMVKVGAIGPKDDHLSYYLGDDLEALQPLRTALRAARGEQAEDEK